MKLSKIDISIISFLIGLLVYRFFLLSSPEVKTERIESIKTDTVFVHIIDTIRITKTTIRDSVIRDTVLIGFEPKIKGFKASSSTIYGNVSAYGEVLGEVLKIDISTNLKIPQITNTITRTERITLKEKPKGLYFGLGLTNNLIPIGQAGYLTDKFLFSYQYQPTENSHSVVVSKKLF